jgi:hypothetical protein
VIVFSSEGLGGGGGASTGEEAASGEESVEEPGEEEPGGETLRRVGLERETGGVLGSPAASPPDAGPSSSAEEDGDVVGS